MEAVVQRVVQRFQNKLLLCGELLLDVGNLKKQAKAALLSLHFEMLFSQHLPEEMMLNLPKASGFLQI